MKIKNRPDMVVVWVAIVCMVIIIGAKAGIDRINADNETKVESTTTQTTTESTTKIVTTKPTTKPATTKTTTTKPVTTTKVITTKAAEKATTKASSTKVSSTKGETTTTKKTNNKSKSNSLGTFKLTAYCNCSKCCGKWAGGATASGTMPKAGRTIAVDARMIPFGTKVKINGHTYTAEDTGSAIKGNRIDIFFNSHSEALKFGVKYAEVFRVS